MFSSFRRLFGSAVTGPKTPTCDWLRPPEIQISFCTTCCNRAHQLTQILEENAAIIAADPELEWVILNYNSTDELHDQVMAKLPQLSPRVIYARVQDGRRWHASVAKNMAHRLGSGNILYNLDNDNRINTAPEDCRRAFARSSMLHQWSGYNREGQQSSKDITTHFTPPVSVSKLPPKGDGSYGRIASKRELFHRLRGYDESFYPMGAQDTDLLLRGHITVDSVPWIPCKPGMSILNTKEESLINCDTNGMVWEEMNIANWAKSQANIIAGVFAVNPEGWSAMRPEIWRGRLGLPKDVAISFCTACLNTDQLRSTFKANAQLIRDNPDVEWVVYSRDTQGIVFAVEQLRQCTTRVVFALDKLHYAWHEATAKNSAHRQAAGQYLVDVPCGTDLTTILAEARAANGQLISTPAGLGISRAQFHALGGYDEALADGWSQDLLRRASSKAVANVAKGWPDAQIEILREAVAV